MKITKIISDEHLNINESHEYTDEELLQKFRSKNYINNEGALYNQLYNKALAPYYDDKQWRDEILRPYKNQKYNKNEYESKGEFLALLCCEEIKLYLMLKYFKDVNAEKFNPFISKKCIPLYPYDWDFCEPEPNIIGWKYKCTNIYITEQGEFKVHKHNVFFETLKEARSYLDNYWKTFFKNNKIYTLK